MKSCALLSCPTQAARLASEAKVFRSLSDPTRLVILKLLLGRSLRVVDLSSMTGRQQPSISAHLASLRDCGLVEGVSHGRETYYSIRDPRLAAILTASDRLLSHAGSLPCDCPILPYKAAPQE